MTRQQLQNHKLRQQWLRRREKRRQSDEVCGNPVLKMVWDEKGTATDIAEACGLKRTAVWMWRRVPAQHVLTVERLLNIPRHRIRPDLYPPPSDPKTQRWMNKYLRKIANLQVG